MTVQQREKGWGHHKCFAWQRCAEHILPVNEKKHSCSWKWRNLSYNSETGPLAALGLFVLLEKKEKQSRKCAEPAVTSQPIPGRDILAIKKWCTRTHDSPTAPLKKCENIQNKKKKKKKKRQDHIMAFGMRRQFVAWMPAPARRQWWRRPGLMESVWLQCSFHQIYHLLCTRRGIELIITRIHT